jgi:hypothetical protein
MRDGELGAGEDAKRQSPLHLDRLPIQIGKKMTRIGRRDGAIRANTHAETGSVRFAGAEHATGMAIGEEG